MGPASSRFRNDDQEQIMRTVANQNENENGSTNDPNPKLTGSTEIQTELDINKDSTNEKGQGQSHLPTQYKKKTNEPIPSNANVCCKSKIVDVKTNINSNSLTISSEISKQYK